MGILYLLRFSKPIGSERHQAQYYLGYTSAKPGSLERRLDEHRHGIGARITRAAVLQGATLEVVQTKPGTRQDERQAKKKHNHKRLLDDKQWTR